MTPTPGHPIVLFLSLTLSVLLILPVVVAQDTTPTPVPALTPTPAAAPAPSFRTGIYRNVKIPNPEVQDREQERIVQFLADNPDAVPPPPLNRFRPILCPPTIEFDIPARALPDFAPSLTAFRSEDLIFDGVRCDPGETYILREDLSNPRLTDGTYTAFCTLYQYGIALRL